MLFKNTILFRLLSIFLPVVILSIAVTSLLLSTASYTAFRKNISQDYRNILVRSVGEIQAYLSNAQKGLESLAWIIAHNQMDLRQKDITLTAFLQVNDQFASISFISNAGEKMTTTDLEITPFADQWSETFQKALRGQNAMSAVRTGKDHIPCVYLAAPVKEMGKVSGVLWSVLNLKNIWDVLKGIKMGQTGELFIMDVSGKSIGHPDMTHVIRNTALMAPEVLHELQVFENIVEWYEIRNQQFFFCMGQRLPGAGWIVVLSQARSEIYSHLIHAGWITLGITAVISLLAGLLGWFQSRRFLKPVQAIHRQVREVAAGNLEQTVAVTALDEIGELAQAFNGMTGKLKKMLQKEIETARELAHAKNLAILGSAAGKMTHEVGNLLNNLDLCLSSVNLEILGTGQKRYFEQIEKDMGLVNALIEDFLQFSRKIDPQVQPMAFQRILQDLLVVYEHIARERGIRMVLDWPSDIPAVPVDEQLMYQAFNNLIKNSLEALAIIGPGEIRIAGRIQGNHLAVTLSDTGPGIQPQTLDRIFEPFFTTKGKKGTGLGLAIVKEIVEAHRGSITCASVPGMGAEFSVELALARP